MQRQTTCLGALSRIPVKRDWPQKDSSELIGRCHDLVTALHRAGMCCMPGGKIIGSVGLPRGGIFLIPRTEGSSLWHDDAAVPKDVAVDEQTDVPVGRQIGVSCNVGWLSYT